MTLEVSSGAEDEAAEVYLRKISALRFAIGRATRPVWPVPRLRVILRRREITLITCACVICHRKFQPIMA